MLDYISRLKIYNFYTKLDTFAIILISHHLYCIFFSLGVLDAVAELLVFEVDAFDIDCPVENRTIRKLIASTLTNLTFGNAQSKRRLCSHPNLIEYTIRIIDDSHGLAQVSDFYT